ncbi:MAG: PLD nuclease N-terminal domain-containing protein, partial [Treponemataceae bacterium]|nr:PLD nuclease N-terminal domain-containing protein [Treponemataceae bacterium]
MNRKNKEKIKKRQKAFLIMNRILVIMLIAVQVMVFLYLIQSTSSLSKWVTYALRLITFLVVLHIISIHEKSGFKLIWTIIVMLFPVFGGVSYLAFHFQSYTARFRKNVTKLEIKTREDLLQTDTSYEDAVAHNHSFSNNIYYLQKTAGFP